MLLNESEEIDWLSRFAKGDETAFSWLYEKYWQRMFDLAYRRLQDAQQAEDIVQDVFVHLWNKRDDLSITNISAYLQRAVRNKIYNLVVHDRVKESYFNYLKALDIQVWNADSNQRFQELSECYQAILTHLPDAQKQIFELRYGADMDTAQIAALLNIKQKTVQNQLLKAVKRIKTIFQIVL